MKNLALMLCAAMFFLLSGCAVNQAKTLGEFRQSTKAVAQESVESTLSYAKLTKVLRNRFNECMNIRIEISNNDGSMMIQTLKPTTKFGATSGKAYLQVATKHKGSIVIGEIKEPPGGRFVTLADVSKKGTKSQIRLVYTNDMHDNIGENTGKMIKSWAKGENLNACPKY